MGLDMYLSAKRWVSDSFMNDDEAHAQLKPLADKLLPPDGNLGSITISRDVAYWRKANQIHNWFVQNVQAGTDDCGTYDVSVEQLLELRDTCEKVLQCVTVEGEKVTVDQERVEKLLPTQDGFFFGSTEYDDGYVEDCKSTIEQIDKIMAWVRAEELVTGRAYPSVDFQYHSRW